MESGSHVDRTAVAASFAQWSLAAMLLLLTLAFFNSSGTGDVGNWTMWAWRAEAQGLVRGFEASNADYPPLATAIALAGIRAGRVMNLDAFHSIKLTILLFYLACTGVVFVWTRSLTLALAFHASIFLNAIAQGYLDVVAALPFLLSLWALRAQRLTMFVVLFGLSVSIKWQPLIVAPFLAVHVIAVSRNRAGRFDVVPFVSRVVAPVVGIVGSVLVLFGATPVMHALGRALSHESLSGNALNANWILTHVLRVYDPSVGGLDEGKASWIVTPPGWAMMAARSAFVVVYTTTTWAYLRRRKTFEQLLQFSVLGFLTYFMLNSGVHENHLFFGALLATVLVWLKPDEFWSVLVIVAISNINLLLFGGIDGDELPFTRALSDRYDLALPFAVVNLGFFCWLWGSTVLSPRASVARESQQLLA